MIKRGKVEKRRKIRAQNDLQPKNQFRHFVKMHHCILRSELFSIFISFLLSIQFFGSFFSPARLLVQRLLKLMNNIRKEMKWNILRKFILLRLQNQFCPFIIYAFSSLVIVSIHTLQAHSQIHCTQLFNDASFMSSNTSEKS